VRVAIAACIWRSILRIGEFGWLPLYYTHGPTPSGELVTNWNNPQKSQPDRFDKKRTVLETVQKIVHVIQVFLVSPVKPIWCGSGLVTFATVPNLSLSVTLCDDPWIKFCIDAHSADALPSRIFSDTESKASWSNPSGIPQSKKNEIISVRQSSSADVKE